MRAVDFGWTGEAMSLEAFKAWRLRLGWSQLAVAVQLGVHPQSISRIERGLVTVPRMMALACEALERRATAPSPPLPR